jgi:hypothetical protein
MAELAEIFITGEVGIDGTGYDIVEHPLYVQKDNNSDQQNSDQRTYDMPPEFFQVIYERHIGSFFALPPFNKG